MNEDKVFIEGHVVGLFADTLGKKGKQIKVASGDIVNIDDNFIYKLIGPETGHADEAPRYIKNILVRLRELPVHDREVWLKAIMGEFKEDFSHVKWREGYEQGKFEGEWVGNQLKDADKVRRELNKVKVKQFVADWYEENKDEFELNLWIFLTEFDEKNIDRSERFGIWLGDEDNNPIQTLVNMHQFGYEVEEEKKFFVKIKCLSEEYKYLNYFKSCREWLFSEKEETKEYRTAQTRKQLEEAGFGWVFDCPGVEIEEVE